MALEQRRNLITDPSEVLAHLASLSCFQQGRTQRSTSQEAHTPLAPNTQNYCCFPDRWLWNSLRAPTQPKDSPSFTPDTLFCRLLTCVLLPVNERGFPPPPAKGEKGHSDGNSLPSFPLVLVCCCFPSKEKEKHQSVLAQTVPIAQFQVQAFGSKAFHLESVVLRSMDC